jgi:GNAT superfamily N-acetyltransferase
VPAVVGLGSPDDVRAIARRRQLDELSLRLALHSAERATVWVARDEGTVIGIAIAHDSDDERLVGDCFVEPSFRGQGVGSELLDATFGGDEARARALLVAPNDAASLASAFRLRLAPREAIVRFAGAIPREEALAKMAAGDYRFSVDAIDPVSHRYALDELDRQTRGTTRGADHALFAHSLANGQAFFLNGECVGYAYLWPDGRIGPLAGASEAYLVQMLAFALVTLQRQYGASWCTLLVPSSNRRIARAALRAGLRIAETQLFASDAHVHNLATYIGYHRLLF